MPIKVYKVADIIDGVVVVSGSQRFRGGDVAAVLTNLAPPPDADPASAWKMEIEIGEDRRQIEIDLAPILSKSYLRTTPLFIFIQYNINLLQRFTLEIACLCLSDQPLGLLIRKKLFYGLRKPFTTRKLNYPAFARRSPT